MDKKNSTFSIAVKLLLCAALISSCSINTKAEPYNSKNEAVNLTEVTKIDGKYFDSEGNEVNNVVTQYSKKNVIKYFDPQTGEYLNSTERDPNKTYRFTVLTVSEPHYYAVSVNKTQYGKGSESVGFAWSKGSNYNTFTQIDSDADVKVYYSNANITSEHKNNPTGDVNETFVRVENSSSSSSVYGGAITNENNSIDSINGDFINNTVKQIGSGYGGAIYNKDGTITAINSNFAGNKIESQSSYGYGGAIANVDNSEITDITGNFVGNTVIAGAAHVYGGAIYNLNKTASTGTAKIGNIKGDFIGNSVTQSGPGSSAKGGAIYNYDQATIENIEGNFIGNYAHTSAKGTAQGGAIYNEKASLDTWVTENKIGNIKGDFIGNYAVSTNNADGGAIFNLYGTVGDISGDFIGNYAEGTNTNYGGAIYNSRGYINSVEGLFIGNHIVNTSSYTSSGGAVATSNGSVASIKGSFYNNYAESKSSLAYGGAIYVTSGTVDSVEGDFVNNHASGASAQGGAIQQAYNGKINEIKNSNFYDNYAEATAAYSKDKNGNESGVAYGGAIYTRTDLNITADNGKKSEFKGNYTILKNGTKDYNAIYVNDADRTVTLKANNSSELSLWDNINGKNPYTLKLVSDDGSGKISLFNDVLNANVEASNVTVNFANNVIHNYELLSLKSDDSVRYNIDICLADKSADTLTIKSAQAGTIVKLGLINVLDHYDGTPVIIQILKTTADVKLQLSDNIIVKEFVKNVLYNDSVVTEAGAIELVNNDSIKISGQIYDALDVISSSDRDEEKSFIFETNDEYIAKKDLGTVAAGTLNIVGQSKNASVINGNDKTLFKLDNQTTLNIQNTTIKNAASVISGSNENAVVNISNSDIKDNKSGISMAGNLNVSGNTTIKNNGEGIKMTSASSVFTIDARNGEVTINDNVKGTRSENGISKLNLKGGNINLHKKVSDMAVSLDSSKVKLHKDDVLNNLDISVQQNSMLNYANNLVNAISFNSLTLYDNLNLAVDVDLANKTMDTISAATFNANAHNINVNAMTLLSDAKQNLTSINFADDVLKDSVTTTVHEVAYSPIYKYNVSYDKESGDFIFQRGSGSGGSDVDYSGLNPAIMTSPVAAQLGGYVGMVETYHNAFTNMDMRMLNPLSVRTAQANANKYALSDYGNVSFLENETNSQSIWLRPFASYDKVGLKNGPKVNNFTFGSFIGGDTAVHEFENGAQGVLSAHVSYLGSHQTFAGNSIWQNGGNLGFTGTYYKGNFFSGLTLNAGASVAEANNMFGKEDFTMFMAGVANKTGYNFEFKEGRYIMQPSLLLSYTFVNTFDYTNASGIRINTDNLHAIQIHPNIRFAMNTKSNWQPYINLAMNWNIMNDSHYHARMTELPALSVKPYFQYGFGLQKLVNDNFTVFGQVSLRHGGRNGIAANFGLRWLLGSSTKKKNTRTKI